MISAIQSAFINRSKYNSLGLKNTKQNTGGVTFCANVSSDKFWRFTGGDSVHHAQKMTEETLILFNKVVEKMKTSKMRNFTKGTNDFHSIDLPEKGNKDKIRNFAMHHYGDIFNIDTWYKDGGMKSLLCSTRDNEPEIILQSKIRSKLVPSHDELIKKWSYDNKEKLNNNDNNEAQKILSKVLELL